MTDDQAATVAVEEQSVTVERVFNATPKRLFQVWTDPKLVERWLSPGPMACKVPVYEAKKGGRFRIEMTGPGPDGEMTTFSYEGTFDHVEPAERIVMAWPAADPSGAGPPSVVTVTFTPVAGGTLVRLVQDGMPGIDFAKGAGMGWQSAFEKLAGVL